MAVTRKEWLEYCEYAAGEWNKMIRRDEYEKLAAEFLNAPFECKHEPELRPGTASSEPSPGIIVCRKCGFDFYHAKSSRTNESDLPSEAVTDDSLMTEIKWPSNFPSAQQYAAQAQAQQVAGVTPNSGLGAAGVTPAEPVTDWKADLISISGIGNPNPLFQAIEAKYALQKACDAYWAAKTREEEREAAKQIIAAGGPDPYAFPDPVKDMVTMCKARAADLRDEAKSTEPSDVRTIQRLNFAASVVEKLIDELRNL